MDDLLVLSASEEEYIQNIRLLFKWLTESGVIINPGKCFFVVSTLSFLGHQINKDGVFPLPEKVSATENFPQLDKRL